MTKINTASIEAGAMQLGAGPKWFHAYPNTEADRDRYRATARNVLEAAYPHLRAQIEDDVRQEIKDELRKSLGAFEE